MPGLTLEEATAKAARLNKVMGVTARVVTILPGDTPAPEDRGHDVEVTVNDDEMPSRSMAKRIRHSVLR